MLPLFTHTHSYTFRPAFPECSFSSRSLHPCSAATDQGIKPQHKYPSVPSSYWQIVALPMSSCSLPGSWLLFSRGFAEILFPCKLVLGWSFVFVLCFFVFSTYFVHALFPCLCFVVKQFSFDSCYRCWCLFSSSWPHAIVPPYGGIYSLAFLFPPGYLVLLCFVLKSLFP